MIALVVVFQKKVFLTDWGVGGIYADVSSSPQIFKFS